jgi:hypothetical protein
MLNDDYSYLTYEEIKTDDNVLGRVSSSCESASVYVCYC